MKYLAFNWDLGRPETIIVLGVGRGGTSVVAGTLRCLGVCMGEDPHPVKHEWSPVAYRDEGKVDVRSTLRTIHAMDAAHPLWGWKSPADLFAMDTILPLLRNPAVIVVTRDLVDVTLSAQSHGQTPRAVGFNESALVYQVLADRVRFWPHPVLVVSFHEILANPEAFVDLLSAFVQLTPTNDEKQHAIAFNSPEQNAYRAIAPNSPTNTISAGDLQKDAELLAAIHVEHYSAAYIERVGAVAQKTKSLLQELGQNAAAEPRAAAITALGERAQPLLARFAVDISFADEAGRLRRTGNAAETLRVLGEIAGRALHTAEAVRREIESSKANPLDGYPLLRRLHRILLLLIALQNELRRARHHIKFRGLPSS